MLTTGNHKASARQIRDQVLGFRVTRHERALVARLARLEDERESTLLRRLLVGAVADRLSELAGTPPSDA